jgi:hypothetical protein
MENKLVLEDKSLRSKSVPVKDLNSISYQGEGWDITIYDEGFPYISIAFSNDYKLIERKPSWRGKVLEIRKRSSDKDEGNEERTMIDILKDWAKGQLDGARAYIKSSSRIHLLDAEETPEFHMGYYQAIENLLEKIKELEGKT